MRRPLLMVCLCLVTIAAVRLWYYDSLETGETKPMSAFVGAERRQPDTPVNGEIIIVTGSVYQKDAQSFVIQSLFLSDAANPQQNNPFNENLICELNDETGRLNLRVGSTVTVQGTYRSFSEATNPGEFDMAEYYRTLGIVGKLTDLTIIAQSEEYSVWREALCQLRVYFKNRLYTVFPQKEASVLTAMLLGDKEELDTGIKDLYQENGIIHILSISGLHITLIGMSIYQMLRRSGVPIWLAAICGGSILCLYGVMTGLSVSACRAIGMYLLRMLAEVVGRTYDMLTALGVLATVMVWQNPFNLYNAGFLLSFGAILGIGWLYPALLPEDRKEVPQHFEPHKWKRILGNVWREWRKSLLQSLLAGSSVTLFTLPIQLWFYYEIPTYSILLNLLIFPFMSIVMMTGLGVMIVPGTGIIGTVTCLILQGYEWLCKCFEQLPFHTWNPGKPKLWQVVVYYMIIWAIVLLREKRNVFLQQISKRQVNRKQTNRIIRCMWIPAMLTLAVLILTLRIRTRTTVTFLDVGQGDCIVVETASGEVFLFDCGSSNRNQVGEYVLLPFLKYSGIRHIDAVFVSHADKDHCSGVEELLDFGEEEGISVGQLVLPGIAMSMREEEMSSLQQSDIRIAYISAGDTFATENSSFLCLHPPKGYESEDSNACSQCFYVEVRDGKNRSDVEQGTADEPVFSLLLTGDAEGESEELLTQELKHRDITNVTVLKVAHHGSRYSTSEEFLEVVRPQLAVISCGRNNSYGHPHEETLERLSDCGAVILTTPEYGAITVEVSNGVQIYGFDGTIRRSYPPPTKYR